MPGPLYPWTEWFRKKSFLIPRSAYDCSISAMVQQVRNAAHRLGHKIHLKERKDGSLYVRVLEEDKVHAAC